MAISPEIRARILDVLNNESKRTKRVIEILAAEGIDIDAPKVRSIAENNDIVLERGPEEGAAGGGRPRDSRDRRPRARAKAPSAKRELIRRMRSDHPDWTEEQIGVAAAKELGLDKPLPRQLVNYHLKTK